MIPKGLAAVLEFFGVDSKMVTFVNRLTVTRGEVIPIRSAVILIH